MIYLQSFHIPSRKEDEDFFDPRKNPKQGKANMTVHSSVYPFVLFRMKGMPDQFEFRDITIFCGDNGSGKSTLLNVMSEMLGLKRDSLYNRSDFFDDYLTLCRYKTASRITPDSRIITSDDVFSHVLKIRRVNSGIDDKRQVLIDQYLDSRSDDADTLLHSLSDYDRWKEVNDARKKSGSEYLRSRLIRNLEERSNGESALSFFVDAIADGGLYLLDEPENSLSAQHQMDLKFFLEDCVRNHNCQFILSTHSPFLLSLKGARVYDIDSTPVEVRKWDELDCVKVYKDFFCGNL